jgi:nucleoid-associated protein YgaU
MSTAKGSNLGYFLKERTMAVEQKKGFFDKAVDAMSSRDEIAAAQNAQKEAETRAQAAEAKVQTVQTALAAAESRAKQAEARIQAVEKAQTTAEAKVKEVQTALVAAESRAKQAEAKVTVAEKAKTQLQAEVDRLKKQLEETEKKLAEVRTYVVKSGDSLSKIAQQVYGDMNRWGEIFEANKDQIKDPNVISVGMKLRLP